VGERPEVVQPCDEAASTSPAEKVVG
jgi:hypothetical protein